MARPAENEARLIGGRWQLIRPLAEGGMGMVWVARHRITGRYAALKILEQHDDDTLERFRREAAVTAELNHPGIVEVLDAGTADEAGAFFIAMELLDGCTLHDVMKDPQTTVNATLELLDEMLVALGAAHDRGVVHRDLKPANIFVVPGRRGQRVRLLDFGIARKEAAAGMTQTGTSMGTPYYMPPEQALDARSVSGASDVWSTGVMIYEAIAGTLPFTGRTAHGIIVAACTDPHVPLRERCEVDRALSDLVDQCLAKDPEERPRDAHALRCALQPFLESELDGPLGRLSMDPAALRSGVRRSDLPARAERAKSVALTAAGGALVAGASALVIAGALPIIALPLGILGGALVARGVVDRNSLRVSAAPMPPIESLAPMRRVPSRGSREADVTIVAFADVMDTTSRKALRVLERVLKRHENVRLIWHGLPCTPRAALVEQAMLEAASQGGDDEFWRMHSTMLQLARAPDIEGLVSRGESQGLHAAGFRFALDVGRHRRELESSRDLATQLGVCDAPAFFVGGERIDRLTDDGFDSAITRALGHEVDASVQPANAETVPSSLQRRVAVRQLVIKWRGLDPARADIVRSRAAAAEKAAKIAKRARMPETDFAVLARRFADECIDSEVVMLAELCKPLRVPAATLDIGGVSEVVETDRGFQVLKRYA